MDKLTSFAAGCALTAAVFIIVSFRKPRAATFVISEVTFDNKFTVKGDIQIMELQEGKKATFTLAPKTRHGHAATVEPGSVRVSSSDPSIVSAEQDPTDELKVICRGLDGSENGSVVVEIRGDADLGEGVREIIATKSIVCTQGEATVIDLGEPVIEDDEAPEQPAAEGEGAAGSGSSAGNDAGSGVTDPNAEAGEVKPGDPGTATGEPLDSGAPKGEDAPGEIGGKPVEDVPGASDEPIAGSNTAGQPNPVAGTEASSKKPE